MRRRHLAIIATLLVALFVAMPGCDDTLYGEPLGPVPPPASDPPEPVLRRLTTSQYLHIVRDVFGDRVEIATGLEPDQAIHGLFAVGAGLTSISPRGVDQYEAAAYQIARQALDDPEVRDRVIACTATEAVDDACTRQTVASLGRRLWRRPLERDEQDVFVDLAALAATELGTHDDGLEFAIAGLLQSPHFLFRVELGALDPDRSDRQRFTDWELASRLSFFLWDSGPDEDLLRAAEDGSLSTEVGRRDQVRRMLASDQARDGVSAFFSQMLALHELDDLAKDPTIFPHFSDGVGASARTETLLALDHLVFDRDADYRSVFTTRQTFVDRKLASMYNVRAPAREGFGFVELPDDGRRRGLLGHASLLSLHAHPVSSSATRRGVFIREVLLCDEVPPPPASLNTSIPEPSPDEPTLRDRVAVHLTDPTCASCHIVTDPVGLALENFDGMGLWRDTENDVGIDASGELDGDGFEDAWALARVLHDHPSIGPCLTSTMVRFAEGRQITVGEEENLQWQMDRFEDDGYRVLALMEAIALNPNFARAGVIEGAR